LKSERFKQEKEYQARMSVIRSALKSGLITKKDYDKIDTIFIKKYGSTFGGLYH